MEMLFKEPSVELIEIDMNNTIITDSCDSNANANPDMQACSAGAPHELSCEDEASDWVD